MRKDWLVVGGICAAILIPGYVISTHTRTSPVLGIRKPITSTTIVEYRKEVEWGDTLWDICSDIATDETDLRLLVWQAKKDNHITDPSKLQPGTEIIVRVPEVVRDK